MDLLRLLNHDYWQTSQIDKLNTRIRRMRQSDGVEERESEASDG